MGKKKNKKQFGETMPLRRPWIPAMTHFAPIPKQIVAGDIIVRRLEYFDALAEVSGSTEGNELESLSRTSHDQYRDYSFQETENSFEDLFE